MFEKKRNPEWEETGVDSMNRPVYRKISSRASSSTADNGTLDSIRLELSNENVTLIPADIPISPCAQKVINRLHEAGYTPYLVGGKIRDHLMGIDSKDVDIEVYGVDSMDKLAETVSGIGGKVGIAGQSFGVVKYTEGKEEFDISMPRRDSLGEGDNVHRSIIATTDASLTPMEASLRRDFTFNALMYDPLEGNIIDHHGGVEDIEDGVIRIVDADTFTDDPLRVLRGVQFAGRFNFEMDEESVALCRSMTWEGLAKERVAGEIHKMLTKSRNLHQGVSTLHEVGWTGAVPGLDRNLDNPLDQEIVDDISSLRNHDDAVGLVASLMDHHYGDGDGALASSLMLTGRQRRVFNVMRVQDASDVVAASRMRRFLHGKGLDQSMLEKMSSSVGVQAATKVWEGNPPEYTVDGSYLIGQGLKPGPDFKEIITRCGDMEDSGMRLDREMIDSVIRNVVES